MPTPPPSLFATRHRRALFVALAAVAGCTCGGSSAPPVGPLAATSTVAVTSDPSAESAAPGAPEPGALDWRQAARVHDWDAAFAALDALPPAERNTPEMRLAYGRIALAANQPAVAVEALHGLPEALPVVKGEVERWLAEAGAVAGPHGPAAAFLERSARVTDLVLAAQAHQRAGDLAAALRVADQAVKRAGTTRGTARELAARATRAAIAEQSGKTALAVLDWQWVVKHAPEDARARDALEGIDRVKGFVGMEDRLNALARSTGPDNLAATLTMLDAVAAAHERHRPAVSLSKARAIYAARDYERARVAFDEAVKAGTPFTVEARYYAAHAATRAGDIDDGLRRYEAVAAATPASIWTELASYRHAELLLQRGLAADAVTAFARFAALHPRSTKAADASYMHGLALLAAGEPGKARTLFEALLKTTRARRSQANLQHLIGVSALAAGDRAAAVSHWLGLIADQPLTWPALAAHTRLQEAGYTPLPPLIGPSPPSSRAPFMGTLPAGPSLLASLGLDTAAEESMQALEQHIGDGAPGREGEALCSTYGLLAVARRTQQVGNRAVPLATLMRPPSAAERWAWRCVYPTPYADLIEQEERRYGLPAGLVHALMRQESAFRTTAVSPVGARGLMQLMPNTARRAAAEAGVAVPSDDHVVRPFLNVRLGAFYIGKLLETFDGNVTAAIAGYNAGPHAVERWLRHRGDVPADVWVARIPYNETREYVSRVLTNFARYRYLHGGLSAVPPFSLSLPNAPELSGSDY